MKYGSLASSVAVVVLFAGSCGVSNSGLQESTGAGGAAGAPPNPERAGGAGGRPPSGSGGAAGSSVAGTGGAPAMPGTGGGSPPPPEPAADAAAPAEDGRSGINSIDGAGNGEVAPPPIDGAPPASEKGVCRGAGALGLCLAFEGSVTDESEGRLTVSARHVSFVSGPTGMAAQMGSDSALIINGAGGLAGGAVTLEAWVQPERLPAAGQRAGLVDRDGHYGLFLLPGGDIGCSKNGTMVTAPAGIRVGTWASVACTANGSEIAVWVNGVRRGSGPSEGGVGGAQGAPVALGSNSPSGDNFVGLIDNVRIWTRVRTQPEICQTALGCE